MAYAEKVVERFSQSWLSHPEAINRLKHTIYDALTAQNASDAATGEKALHEASQDGTKNWTTIGAEIHDAILNAAPSDDRP